MKNQQVSVDYWAMGKSMVTYGALTALCWLMLRLFGAVFTLPRRLRAQQQTIQESLQELQASSVDYWAMGKSMVTYGALTALCWLMLRLFGAVFTLPRRLRAQQQTIQESLQELQASSVDYWAMGKSMVTYGALTALCWLMLRLFGAVFTLPRRLRAQQQTIQESLQELQKRFPDLNITEEDLLNAEKELDELIKEGDTKSENELTNEKDDSKLEEKSEETPQIEEKKTL